MCLVNIKYISATDANISNYAPRHEPMNSLEARRTNIMPPLAGGCSQPTKFGLAKIHAQSNICLEMHINCLVAGFYPNPERDLTVLDLKYIRWISGEGPSKGRMGRARKDKMKGNEERRG